MQEILITETISPHSEVASDAKIKNKGGILQVN
jgi:hypothetical protein